MNIRVDKILGHKLIKCVARDDATLNEKVYSTHTYVIISQATLTLNLTLRTILKTLSDNAYGLQYSINDDVSSEPRLRCYVGSQRAKHVFTPSNV